MKVKDMREIIKDLDDDRRKFCRKTCDVGELYEHREVIPTSKTSLGYVV